MTESADSYELRALITQLAALSREVENVRTRLEPFIGDSVDIPTFSVRGLQSLDDVERGYIQHVLGALDGNKSKASYVLGVDASTLHRKIARWVEGEPESR